MVEQNALFLDSNQDYKPQLLTFDVSAFQLRVKAISKWDNFSSIKILNGYV